MFFNKPKVKEISAAELRAKLGSGQSMQLVDVREPDEYAECRIEGCEHIPLGKVLDHASSVKRDRPVVVYCAGGVRSAKAIAQLEKEHGFDNLYNLTGGIRAWLKHD